MFKGWAILPAAKALFNKAKIELSEITKEWADGTVVVCKKPNGQLHFIAGSSGNYSDLGRSIQCYHDQTGAQFPGEWLVVNQVSFKTVDGQVQWEPQLPFNNELNVCTKAALAVFK